MPYIGVAPSSGLFKKLDAITVVNAQAAYTMQYNSSNFKPATAEQLIVSVNGVIQAPNDAYTVSGSTITFSENLVTGDVIDFIVALGEVGNTVTPVDGSVDINKMSSSLMTESGGSTTIKGALSIDSSGNVGVGTASPNTYGGKLNITDGSVGGETTLVVANNNANQFVRVGINGDVAQIAYDNADSLAFGIATDSKTSGLTTEHMRITNSGNLFLGKTSSSAATNGIELKANSSENGLLIATATSNRAGIFNRRTSNGDLLQFRRDNSGVGSISVTTSTTSYNTSSDYRLKENVTDITDATTRLKQLNPVRFNFIADADTTVDGFLAHEVQSVVPEAISGTKDAVDDEGNPVYQGIDQSKLVPLLVKTIQELEERITALENA